MNYPFNPSILIAGIAVILISLIAFYRNVTSRIIFNEKDKTILFKKGLFRTDHYRYFKDVQELRYRTYDVKNSASQFTKGAREYIADIRLLWRDQGSIEMCYFSRRVKEEIQLAETVFVELSVYTGLKNTTTIVP